MAEAASRDFGAAPMEPVVRDHSDIFALRLEPGRHVSRTDVTTLLLALQHALMASAGDERHAQEGRIFVSADAGEHGQCDWVKRLLVVAPWCADRSKSPQDTARWKFDRAVRALTDLRAGSVGRFQLVALPLQDGDPVVGPATTWKSVTPYLATRHAKKMDSVRAALVEDLLAECSRRGIPAPERLGISEVSVGPGQASPSASVTLHFASAFRGPLLLGRDSHSGGGLFHAVPPSDILRSRQQAWKELRTTMAELGKEATRRGLTDAELERLLADES